MASGHWVELEHRLPPEVQEAFFRWGIGRGMGSIGALHVGVLPVFAKGAVPFVRGRGAQAASEDRGPHYGGLVGEPGSEGPRSVEEHPPQFLLPRRRTQPPLPGGLVRVGSAAAARAEAEAPQDGEQGGAPAQVEGGAQLVPGDRRGAGQR